MTISSTTIGVLGLSRVGKSSLLTNAFELDSTVFSPGYGDEARTKDIRVHRVTGALLVDFPGANEGEPVVAATNAYATDLLDIVIFVLDYGTVHTDGARWQLGDLARNFLRSGTAPCVILLNAVDKVVCGEWLDAPELAMRDMDIRKDIVVGRLAAELGSSSITTTIGTRVANAQGAEQIHHHRAKRPLKDLVHVSCLDLNENTTSGEVQQFFGNLWVSGQVWSVNNVRTWLRLHCSGITL